MKIFKHLMSLLKILFPLIVIVSLVYFRHIIFQPYINSPFDTVQAMAEKEFDITVPVYIPHSQSVEVVDDNLTSDSECVTDAVVESSIEEQSDQVDNEPTKSTVDVSKIDKDISVTAEPLDDPLTVETKENVSTSEPESAETDSFDNQLMSSMFETIKTMDQKMDELFEMNRERLSKNSISSSENTNALYENQDITTNNSVNHASESDAENLVENITNNSITPSSDILSMLSLARQAYWRGNIQQSESMYLRLVNLDNTNPDMYGELGNVYYAQGKWRQAGKAYYEAAIRFIDMDLHDNNNQIDYLLRIIQGLDADSAEKLRAKLAG